jgi:hypothetical protein
VRVIGAVVGMTAEKIAVRKIAYLWIGEWPLRLPPRTHVIAAIVERCWRLVIQEADLLWGEHRRPVALPQANLRRDLADTGFSLWNGFDPGGL